MTDPVPRRFRAAWAGRALAWRASLSIGALSGSRPGAPDQHNSRPARDCRRVPYAAPPTCRPGCRWSSRRSARRDWRAASTPAIAPSPMVLVMRAEKSRSVCATTRRCRCRRAVRAGTDSPLGLDRSAGGVCDLPYRAEQVVLHRAHPVQALPELAIGELASLPAISLSARLDAAPPPCSQPGPCRQRLPTAPRAPPPPRCCAQADAFGQRTHDLTHAMQSRRCVCSASRVSSRTRSRMSSPEVTEITGCLPDPFLRHILPRSC